MDRSVLWVAVSKLVSGPQLLRLVRDVRDGERAFRLAAQSLTSESRERVLEEADRGWQRVRAMNGRLVLYTDPDFPEALRGIEAPPALLYHAGPLSFQHSPAIAVVGSRHPSPYGLRVAFRMGADLATVGVTVVSGLAMGVDRAAHQGALSAGGPTIAVLGTGLDVPYPASSEKVYWSILERGLIVSEFPPGTRALPSNFPYRNRIISGLSRAVVVVEASERSGTKSTARWAERQERILCAVPGPVTSPLSVGPHRLLLEGATMVTCAGDVLYACGLVELPRKPAARRPVLGETAATGETAAAGDRVAAGESPAACGTVATGEPSASGGGTNGQGGCAGGADPGAVSGAGLPRRSRQALGDEARILQALARLPGDAGELAQACGLPVERVLATLGLLEVEGRVRRWPDGTFHRIETVGPG